MSQVVLHWLSLCHLLLQSLLAPSNLLSTSYAGFRKKGCRTKWSLAKPRFILWFPGKIIIWVPIPYFLLPVPVQQCSSASVTKICILESNWYALMHSPMEFLGPPKSQSICLSGVCFQQRSHCLIPPCKHLSKFYLAHFGYIPLELAPTPPVGSGQCVCMNDSCSTIVTS